MGGELNNPKILRPYFMDASCRSRGGVFSVHLKTFGSVLKTAVKEANITLGVNQFLLFAQFEASK